MKEQAILITGNGFDLHHGLPTSYMDFINITNKLIKKTKGERIIEDGGLFKDINCLINHNFNDNDLYNLITSSNNRFWEDAEKNVWFQYFNFLIENDVIISNWIDFENEILKALKLISNECELINKNNIIKYASSFQNNLKKESNKKFFFKEKEYVTGTEDYLVNLNFYLVIKKFYFINHEYNKHLGVKFLNFNIDEYLEMLFKDLNNFENCFKNYLKTIVNPLIEKEIITEKISFLQKDSNYQIAKHFNFNYTNTISIYEKEPNFKVRNSRFISKNIHGKIENDNIIFGIDDIDSIIYEKSKYLMFTKYYRRLVERCNDSKSFINFEGSGTINKIVFFGHSLDKSDKTYIIQILDHVYSKLNNVAIDIYYHSITSQSSQIKNLIEIYGREKIEKMFSLNIINMIKIENPPQ